MSPLIDSPLHDGQVTISQCPASGQCCSSLSTVTWPGACALWAVSSVSQNTTYCTAAVCTLLSLVEQDILSLVNLKKNTEIYVFPIKDDDGVDHC